MPAYQSIPIPSTQWRGASRLLQLPRLFGFTMFPPIYSGLLNSALGHVSNINLSYLISSFAHVVAPGADGSDPTWTPYAPVDWQEVGAY